MTRGRLERALLLARTARHLRPAQVAHRARLRAQRWPASRPVASSLISLLPVPNGPLAGWPAGYVPLDLQLNRGSPSPEDNVLGRFAFLNDTRDLGSPVDWDARDASRLWRYHLHYLEWAFAFAAQPDRARAANAFAGLWRSWQGSVPFGRGDAWHPYVASLRAWALCAVHDALVAGTAIQADVDASLVRHAVFLRWHVEHDVGGNHLLKNLKALVGLGVFLDDGRLVRQATDELRRQLAVQILDDGGHYERSPSYHCQVLGDLIDVAGLLTAAGRPPVSGLAETIESMRSWLGAVLMPDGDVPLFNDCTLVGRDRVSLLGPRLPAGDSLIVLEPSGYLVVRPDDRLHLVADVGDPCPRDLPAHAHADCLTFELAVDGERVVVDAGTSTYSPGPVRGRERSTAAHNTVTVDDADQTEVWGVFRAARRARATLERAGDDTDTITIVGSHDGYRRLRGAPVHRRTWQVWADRVTITDEVLGTGDHGIASRLHLADADRVKVTWSGPPELDVTEAACSYATGFGREHDGTVVAAIWRGELPVTLQVELHLDRQRLGRSSA